MLNKPPLSTKKNKAQVTTTVRLPLAVHQEVQAAAKRNDRSMNDEIVARIELPPGDARLAAMERQLEELSRLVRRLLDEAG